MPLRPVLVQPLELGEEPDPEVDAACYAAAAQLLILALAAHPSLADLMLFPTGLQASAEAPDKARGLISNPVSKLISGLCECMTCWLTLLPHIGIDHDYGPTRALDVATGMKGCRS